MMQNQRFQNQMLFWLAALAGGLFFLWLFQAILLPFILGLAVAYLLNPPVTFLQNRGIPRTPGTLIILAGFFCGVLALLAVTIPVFYRDANDFLQKLPGYLEQGWSIIKPHVEQLRDNLKDNVTGAENDDIQAFISQYASSASQVGKGILSSLAAGGAALGTLISVTVLAPVVSFFMLKEWPAMMCWLEDLMPEDHKMTILDLLKQMNDKISGFIRGQLMVAFVLGVVYAVALSVAGLHYAILVGVLSGVLTVIPMLGSIVGVLLGTLIAWFQTGDWEYVLIIAGIFLTGQIVESNVLTPKLIGQSVGLHPLWIFFALLAGGALAGILGMMVAVPLAAVIGVLVSFAINQYKSSSLYKKSSSKSGVEKKEEKA